MYILYEIKHINQSIYLSICLSVCLSIYLSIYVSVCLSLYLSIYLSIYLSFLFLVALSISPTYNLSLSSVPNDIGGYVNFRRVGKPGDDGKIRFLPTHDEREYKIEQRLYAPTIKYANGKFTPHSKPFITFHTPCTDNVARGTGFCLSTNQLVKLIEGLFLEPVPGRSTRRDFDLKELELGKQGLEKVSIIAN